MNKFRPLLDRILIKRSEATNVSPGGIIIPDAAKEHPWEGTVLAAGPGAIKDDGSIRKMDVKVGDLVLFDRYAGAEIKLDGESVWLVSEGNVIGVIQDPKKT